MKGTGNGKLGGAGAGVKELDGATTGVIARQVWN